MYILISDGYIYKLIKSDDNIKSILMEMDGNFYKPLFVLDYIKSKALYFYDKERNIYCVYGIDDMENFMKIISNQNEQIKTLETKEENLIHNYFKYDKIAFDMLNSD